ncbi:MAG TPA: PilZ domain-containing protein [Caulobacteraceae bacterium]|nr:PilZ domain-containing protein [Caulobacteraceae bacterium]
MGQSAVRIAPSSRDRRAAERIATSLRGKAFPGALDCVITDFSKKGARLRFDEPPPKGGSMIVVVWSSGFAFDAHVRWRRGLEVGVQFASSRDLRRPAPPHLAEAQALWMKRRPRVGRRALIASPVILQKKSRGPRRLAAVRPEP